MALSLKTASLSEKKHYFNHSSESSKKQQLKKMQNVLQCPVMCDSKLTSKF